jgi:hypothetical protein
VGGHHSRRLQAVSKRSRVCAAAAFNTMHRRNDSQVKVRGHRVELGEVEAGVSQNSLVSRCCAACEGPTLIAFITLSEKGRASLCRAPSPSRAGVARALLPLPDHPCRLSGVTESVIRWRLRRTLPGVWAMQYTHASTRFEITPPPAYAHPHAFVLMPSFEVGATGKVNRRSLPSPLSSLPPLPSFAAIAAPLSKTCGALTPKQNLFARKPRHACAGRQEWLADVYRSALASTTYSPAQNFFAAGGDSLSAFRVVKVRVGVGVRVRVRVRVRC